MPMQFIPEDEPVEVEVGEKREKRKRLLRPLHRSGEEESADADVEEVDQIKLQELLVLNLPDWYLVLLGVICSALLGALFPVVAIIFSGFLEVGAYSISHADSFQQKQTIKMYIFLEYTVLVLKGRPVKKLTASEV